mgnify:CR=1 FL=1
MLLNKSNLSEALLFGFPKINWIVNFINISIISTTLGTIYSIQLSLSELLIGFTKKVSDEKIKLSETFSALIITFCGIFFSKIISNMNTGFSIVSIFVVIVYALTNFYLLIKGKSFLDYLIG